MSFLRPLQQYIAWLASALAITAPIFAAAQSNLSRASEASLLAVGVSVAAPAMLLASGVQLSVVAVQASAEGTVLVVERITDGMRETLTFSGQFVGGLSMAVGTVIEAIACGTGYILTTAGKVIAFVPNEVGRSLLHNERITR